MVQDFAIWFGIACSFAGGIFSLYVFINGKKESKDTSVDERLKALELENAKAERRLEGFQQEIERVADAGEQRCKTLEGQLQTHNSGINSMREEQATLKAQVQFLVEGFNKLDTKMDRTLDMMRELLHDSRR